LNKIFQPSNHFKIPDETLISPFLNPKDSMSDLPFHLIDGFSLAHGVVKGNSKSKIHVHPHVDQVTYVLSGKIILNMKGDVDQDFYQLELKSNQSAISIGGEYFQLENPFQEDCHVLYIVSPAYIFEMKSNHVIFDDAIILDNTWEELKKMNWQPPELNDEKHSSEERIKSLERLKKLKLG